MKILSVIGTRPEAIKLAILHKLLLEHEKFQPILYLSGQHTTLASEVLDVFGVEPDYCGFLSHKSQTMAHTMADLLKCLQDLIKLEIPELIIVQGDTLSSYCGAMVGFLNHIPVAHVEAGLRTNNKWSPYPEEIFRKFNDALADIHFAASKNSVANLKAEGITDSVYLTGNTGIDALMYMHDRIISKQEKVTDQLQALVSKFKRDEEKIVVLTLHRREGHKTLIPEILNELNALVFELGCQIVFPVHTNPKVRNAIEQSKLNNRIHCVDNLVYHEFIWLMMQCDLILTDSGGVQEEAPYLGKPVIVLREVTERNEVVALDNNKMYRYSHLKEDIKELLNHSNTAIRKPYGEGQASREIVKILEARLNIF